EDRGVRPDPRLFTTGRCAIPQELTMLRPDTRSSMRAVGARAVGWRWSVRRSVATFAFASGIGLAAAGASHAMGDGERAVAASRTLQESPRAPAMAVERSALARAVAPRSEHPSTHPVKAKARKPHERLRAAP
ncbi:MAG TPA: hypothetical protein VIF09_07995, partial [Polyangiaceae bacterium]